MENAFSGLEKKIFASRE